MNEKIQYATMLEMPFSTANVTVMPPKKRKKKSKPVNAENVKQELIQKVNQEYSAQEAESYSQPSFLEESMNSQEQEQQEVSLKAPTVVDKKPVEKKGKGRFKISVIAVQIALIGALIATIFLTNAINPNSGINTFFKGAFSNGQNVEVVDQRLYSEFAPVISYADGEYAMKDGVMTLSKTGSVYSPCDGVITSVSLDGNGKYNVQIEHSTNFKTLLTGLNHVYGEKGSTVYSNIPVGYMAEQGATLCFTSADGSIISGYQIVDNSVVWAV